MGCDIHLVIEKKKDGEWSEIEIEDWVLPLDRNYDLFAFLSHVRGNLMRSPVLTRGWPSDRPITKSESSPYHSHGHFYLDEMEKWKWPLQVEDCYFRIFFEKILPRHHELWPIPDHDIRVLVYYDN